MKKIKQVVAGIVALGIAAAAVLAMFPDRKDAGDADLLVASEPPVPASKNSHADFLKLKANLQLTDEERRLIQKCVSDPACSARPLRALLARNAQALRHFEDLRGKRFVPPEWADPAQLTIETPLPPLMPVSQAGSLALLRARDLREQGKHAEALESSLRTAEVGQALEASGAPLIACMIGVTLKLRGLQALQEFAQHPGASLAGHAAALARLERLRDNRAGLKHALRLEYTMSANLIARVKDHGFPEDAGARVPRLASAMYFKANRSRAMLAESFRGMIGAIDQVCPPAPQPHVPPRPFWRDPSLLTGNLIGSIMHAIAVPNFDGMPRRRCEEDFWIGAAELTLAAKAFAKQTGRPPSGAADLSPRYLPRIPQDPFTGRPLAYSAGEISTPGLNAQGQPLKAFVKF